MATDKANLRASPRLPLTPKGEILDGDTALKAIVQDLSDSGMSVLCSKEFAAGKILKIRMQLSQGITVECDAEVRHSYDMITGLRIVSMDEKNRRAYDRYLQEYYSQHLGKSG